MILLIQYTLLFASVLMLVALGGCFSEHSGVINLGLEGIMVMGALGGALVMKYLPAGTSAFVIVLLVILASMLMGLIYSSLPGRCRRQLQRRPDLGRHCYEHAGSCPCNCHRKVHQRRGKS